MAPTDPPNEIFGKCNWTSRIKTYWLYVGFLPQTACFTIWPTKFSQWLPPLRRHLAHTGPPKMEVYGTAPTPERRKNSVAAYYLAAGCGVVWVGSAQWHPRGRICYPRLPCLFRYSNCPPKFVVQNAQEEPVFIIDGPVCLCRCICCPTDIDFHVMSPTAMCLSVCLFGTLVYYV